MTPSKRPDITFKALQTQDFEIFASWLAEPHVAEWFREPATVEFVDHEYGDCTRGDMTTRVYLAYFDGKPKGMAQVYELEDYTDHATKINLPGGVGIDYMIGDPNFIGHGLGQLMIKAFIDDIVRKLYPGGTGIGSDPEVANLASVGALERNGFIKVAILPGEHGPEQIMVKRFELCTI